MSDASAAAPVLQCFGLSKVFRDFWFRPRAHAVKGIDLSIEKGEVLGLLGPNGSGKSTTIKMILGLLHPTAGKIAVLGRGPRDVENKRRIGYLPEESYLYKYLTPRETLDFYGKLFGLSPANRRLRTDMLLEMVGLTHAANRAVGEFSKGMQRKVGLAQALINDPEFLILDEPTSGMDPIAIHETKLVIQQLKERGKTVLLCSHQMSEVEDVCDRVVIMYGGKIQMAGSIAELLTVRDESTLSLPALSEAQEAQLRLALTAQGLTPKSVAHPRRSLEKLFFEVVTSARGSGADTAGATAGGRFAGFLGGDKKVAPVIGSAGLQARKEAKSSVLTPVTTPTPMALAVSRPAEGKMPSIPVESDPLLAELTGQKKEESAPAPKAVTGLAPAPVAPKATSATDDVLGELLGEKKTVAPAPAAKTSVAPPVSKSKPALDNAVLEDLLG